MNDTGEPKVIRFTVYKSNINRLTQHDANTIGRELGKQLGTDLLDPEIRDYLFWGIAQGASKFNED